MNLIVRFFVLSVFLLSFVGCKKTETVAVTGFVPLYRVQGQTLLDNQGRSIQLKGIAFGNEVWSNRAIPATHHQEIDYQRVKEMGMNVIRFYLNYKTFEDDLFPYQYKATGWDWIDQNIAWAKRHGIYLLLNMHVPQGGYQSQGNGDALWDEIEYQNRLTALWRAIAERYRTEVQIIGYGLLNEPVPTRHISQWQDLAQRITDSIRTVDRNHLLFIERANWVKGNPETPDYNFPRIQDNQVVYEFHVYEPFAYTHQLFTWANQGDGGAYPDNSVLSYTNASWYTANFNNPTIPAGNTDWMSVTGQRYTVTDPRIKLAVPALVGARVGGRVYFDSIEIREFDPYGDYVQSVVRMNLNSISGWTFWSSNQTGQFGLDSSTGSHDGHSLYIESAIADCNASNFQQVFQPKFHHTYQIRGWMKGEAVAHNAACCLRIDFLETNDPIFGRNKSFLESVLQRYADWGIRQQKPMYLGEFGAGLPCFQHNKGGLQWVGDMLDITRALRLHFTYHTYHEDNFGLYLGYGSLPDPGRANQALIQLFTQRLNP